MEKTIVNQIYFSPTGNCKNAAGIIGEAMAENLDIEINEIDITRPQAREREIFIPKDQVLLMVMPVYASRLPNKIMPFVRDMIRSDGAKAVIGVTYGNRSFGDGLMELKNLLTEGGFKVVSACALACQHSFATKAGQGRPDRADEEAIREFAARSSLLLKEEYMEKFWEEIHVDGNNPVGPYYQPKGIDGEPTVFLKAKVKTDEVTCDSCGKCVDVCPMGSINREDPKEIMGICIKCHSCVKACPKGAKYFDDPAFLSHKAMLEKNFREPKENRFYYLK